MTIREYNQNDLQSMITIWNEIVEEGIAFPQEEQLTEETGAEFFSSQTFCGVAVEDNKIYGLYILHPNNIGRCGHISNASFAVNRESRGKHIGEQLVKHCIKTAKERELKRILTEDPRVAGKKVIIFSEYRATALYIFRELKKAGFDHLSVFVSYLSFSIASPISPSMQIERSAISSGVTASP